MLPISGAGEGNRTHRRLHARHSQLASWRNCAARTAAGPLPIRPRHWLDTATRCQLGDRRAGLRKLKHLCAAFGIPAKESPVDGATFGEWWARDRAASLAYNAQDVEAVRALWHRIGGDFHQAPREQESPWRHGPVRVTRILKTPVTFARGCAWPPATAMDSEQPIPTMSTQACRPTYLQSRLHPITV